MTLLSNDRWTGRFTVTRQGWHEYTIQAWVDRHLTWHRELIKKHEAGQQDLTSELLEGAQLVREAADRATGPMPSGSASVPGSWPDRRARRRGSGQGWSRAWASGWHDSPTVAAACTFDRTLRIMVERERARFGAWYEMFPRSVPRSQAVTAPSATSRHGSTTSRRWASTSSTCRRSTRSAAPSARARTTP